MSHDATLFAALLLAAVALMSALWLLQRATGNAGWVDVGWAGGIGAAVIALAFASEGLPARRTLVAGLCGVWSLRLTLHIWRRVRRETEDGRYAALKAAFPRHTQLMLLGFYNLQALLVVLFAIPAWIAMNHPSSALRVWDLLALAIAVVAIAGETVADRQLARFRRDPANRGRTCRDGLWRYSRHPNYFFEWLHWWCYCAITVGVSAFWLTLIGPALMLYLLLNVTGVPPTEAQALRTRGDDYRRYQQTTSAFFPWFPRKEPDRG